jgi:hypothetical protein
MGRNLICRLGSARPVGNSKEETADEGNHGLDMVGLQVFLFLRKIRILFVFLLIKEVV